MRKKIIRWWAGKSSAEKSVIILTFIVLITVVQLLVLSVRLNEVISMLLQIVRVAHA